MNKAGNVLTFSTCLRLKISSSSLLFCSSCCLLFSSLRFRCSSSSRFALSSASRLSCWSYGKCVIKKSEVFSSGFCITQCQY